LRTAVEVRPPSNRAAKRPFACARTDFREIAMLRALVWVVAIIFIIGLLVVFGVVDLIF
jgi:hypothetical protein